jgi:putative transposase
VVDETKLEVDGQEVYVCAGIGVDTFTNQRFVSHRTARRFETFEVIHVDVSRGRSSLDAFFLLRELLKRCHGKPLVKTDRRPWYNWALETLGCDYEKETFGGRSLRHGPVSSSTEPRCSGIDFLTTVQYTQPNAG